jgi:hypothetical protein
LHLAAPERHHQLRVKSTGFSSAVLARYTGLKAPCQSQAQAANGASTMPQEIGSSSGASPLVAVLAQKLEAPIRPKTSLCVGAARVGWTLASVHVGPWPVSPALSSEVMS